jgi:hypothetical protein
MGAKARTNRRRASGLSLKDIEESQVKSRAPRVHPACIAYRSDHMGLAQRKADEAVRFDMEIRARCPASLISAAEKAAAKNLMTPSEFVRRCIFDRVRADGIDPTGTAV